MRTSQFAALLTLITLCPSCGNSDASSGTASSSVRTAATPTDRAADNHPYREVLLRYIRGCNRGDSAMVASTLAEGITVYFLNLPPVTGREQVAKAWKDYHEASRSRWTIDNVVIQADQAVMEWSALREAGSGPPRLDRGIDWYVFKDGLISEIRQYYDSRGLLPADETYEQKGFPYTERGYPTAATLDSRLP